MSNSFAIGFFYGGDFHKFPSFSLFLKGRQEFFLF